VPTRRACTRSGSRVSSEPPPCRRFLDGVSADGRRNRAHRLLEDRSALFGVLAQIERLGSNCSKSDRCGGIQDPVTPIVDPVRIFAATGDAVARFSLDDPEPEFALEGYQVRCIAIDPAIRNAFTSGRWTAAFGSAPTAAPAGVEPARQSMSPGFSRSLSPGRTSAPACRSSTQAPSRATSIARGRWAQLATAAGSPRPAERVELVFPAAPLDAPRPYDRASPADPESSQSGSSWAG